MGKKTLYASFPSNKALLEAIVLDKFLSAEKDLTCSVENAERLRGGVGMDGYEQDVQVAKDGACDGVEGCHIGLSPGAIYDETFSSVCMRTVPGWKRCCPTVGPRLIRRPFSPTG